MIFSAPVRKIFDPHTYVGIIIDSRYKLNEHIKYVTDRCTKVINALSKSARINWGMRQGALKTIYNGAILPTLPYTAPVWIEYINKEYNRANYVRIDVCMLLRFQ